MLKICIALLLTYGYAKADTLTIIDREDNIHTLSNISSNICNLAIESDFQIIMMQAKSIVKKIKLRSINENIMNSSDTKAMRLILSHMIKKAECKKELS